MKRRSASEHIVSQPPSKRSDFEVVRVFEEQNLLTVSHGNVTKQQKLEVARREQEIRAMKAQNEARRLQNETTRLENEARHLEFMQDLFHD